jgi:hypothetical protein
VEYVQLSVVGGLAIFFPAVEPDGLARLWQSGKQKLRVWPFRYRTGNIRSQTKRRRDATGRIGWKLFSVGTYS